MREKLKLIFDLSKEKKEVKEKVYVKTKISFQNFRPHFPT